MTLEEFIRKALTVPFKEHGRSYEGWDCYGLVYCAYRDVYGIELPEYSDYDSTKEYEQLHSLINQARPLWESIVNRLSSKQGDVVVFTISRVPVHVGLVINKKAALHCEEKLGTFIEPINGSVWGKRVEGIYRYVGISQNDSGNTSVQS